MLRAEPSVHMPSWLRHLPVLVLLALPATQALADIDYDARRDPALRRCDEPRHHGRVQEARDCYTPLLRNASPLVRAEAAFALGDVRRANDLFREAVAADNDKSVLPRLRWGRMFLEAGQPNEAAKLFQEAMLIDEDDVAAQLA